MNNYKIISINESAIIEPKAFYDELKGRFEGMRRSQRDSFNLNLVFEKLVLNKMLREDLSRLVRFVETAFPVVFSKVVMINPLSFASKDVITEKESKIIYRYIVKNGNVNPDTGEVLRHTIKDAGWNTPLFVWLMEKGYPPEAIANVLLCPLLSVINPDDSYKQYQRENFFIIEDHSHHANDYIRELRNSISLTHYLLPTLVSVLLNGQVKEFIDDETFTYKDRIEVVLDQQGNIIQNQNSVIGITCEVKEIYDAKNRVHLYGYPWPQEQRKSAFLNTMNRNNLAFIPRVFQENPRNEHVNKYLFGKQLLTAYNHLKVSEGASLWVQSLISEAYLYYYYQGY